MIIICSVTSLKVGLSPNYSSSSFTTFGMHNISFFDIATHHMRSVFQIAIRNADICLFECESGDGISRRVIKSRYDPTTTNAYLRKRGIKVEWSDYYAKDKEVLRAKDFAYKYHTLVHQKYDGLSYSFHTNAVADIGCEYAHLICGRPSDVISACHLHDTIEDCGAHINYHTIVDEFNESIAEIVFCVTNSTGRNVAEREDEEYYKRIRSNHDAIFVKLCDRIANAQYSKNTGSSHFKSYKDRNEQFEKSLYCEDFKPLFDKLRLIFAD